MKCPPTLLLTLVVCAGSLRAEIVQGRVVDPSGAAVPGATVAAVTGIGVIAQTATDASGAFQITVPGMQGTNLMVTAPGFETRTISPVNSTTVTLPIAPQNDSITVAASAMDVPLSRQGSSVGVISREEIANRNESQAIDLIRDLPGLSVTATGARGAQTSVFIRGGDSEFNLVEIDGIPVNWFGGYFDFAHVPADFLHRIEVIRGAQSAVYGSYANSGVVSFVTRSPEEKAHFEALAEGGSRNERRFSLGGSTLVGGFGFAAFASRVDDDGWVANDDYHNKNLFLTVMRNSGRQSFRANGNYNASEDGQPGPYGSDPAHLFSGIDLVSRNRFYTSDYGAHYQADFSPRVRQELFAGFFWNNGYFTSPFGDSYNNNDRGQLEERTVLGISSHYTMALGYVFAREEVKNTFITDAGARAFPLARDQQGVYWENRLEFGRRLFANIGVRAEIIDTARVPADPVNGRPEFPSDKIAKLNPKLAVAYVLRKGTRIHSSAGTGIRPPSGFEIAFTDNPRLTPERTASFDAGIERRLFQNHLSLESTYFYNRYYDLIVSLGGSLARLSSYRSDNLANSRAHGAEFTARFRPARAISISGSYTFLDSAILSLSRTSHLAPEFFAVGQPLIRRPRHSGTLVAAFARRKFSANVTGDFRGTVLDVEPNFGASAGLFDNPGHANFGINVNYAFARGVTIYGNLRNALNWRYEEAFGYPSPPLNFVSGVKWSFSRSN